MLLQHASATCLTSLHWAMVSVHAFHAGFLIKVKPAAAVDASPTRTSHVPSPFKGTEVIVSPAVLTVTVSCESASHTRFLIALPTQ